MVNSKDVIATIAVRDVKAANLVYQSQYAGTNKATAATWEVGGDIEKGVQRPDCRMTAPSARHRKAASW